MPFYSTDYINDHMLYATGVVLDSLPDYLSY